MRNADNLPPYCAIVKKSRSLIFLDPSGPAWPVTGVLYLYLNTYIVHTYLHKYIHTGTDFPFCDTDFVQITNRIEAYASVELSKSCS